MMNDLSMQVTEKIYSLLSSTQTTPGILNSVKTLKILPKPFGESSITFNETKFSQDQDGMVTVELSKDNKFWSLVANNYSNLQVLHAPESLIMINNLLQLPSSLRYLSLKQIVGFTCKQNENIVKHFPNLIVFKCALKDIYNLECLFEKKNLNFIPSSQEITLPSDSSNEFPEPGCKFAYHLVEKEDFFVDFPASSAESLQKLSLDFNFIKFDLKKSQVEFPNLNQLIIVGLSNLSDVICSIFGRSTALKWLKICGKINESQLLNDLLSQLDNLIVLKLNVQDENDGSIKVSIPPSVMDLTVESTSNVELVNPISTMLKYIEIKCNDLQTNGQQFEFPNLISSNLTVVETGNLASIMESFCHCKSLKKWHIQFDQFRIEEMPREQTEAFFVYRREIPFSNLSSLTFVRDKKKFTRTIMNFEFDKKVAKEARNIFMRNFFHFSPRLFSSFGDKVWIKGNLIIYNLKFEFIRTSLDTNFSVSLENSSKYSTQEMLNWMTDFVQVYTVSL